MIDLLERTSVKAPATYQEWLDCLVVLKGTNVYSTGVYDALVAGSFTGTDVTKAALQRQIVDSINAMLDYDKKIKVLIESKPNEPIDRSYCGTIGHVMAVSAASIDPKRVGAVLESAHAILAGLDPANEMAFALKFGKLGSVHLNDQNGCRYDQDKSFGAESLRSAFDQIKVLCDNNYGAQGQMVGLDVKAMRTQKPEDQYRHIINSMEIVKSMEQKVAKFDKKFQAKCIKERNYEALEMYVNKLIMGEA